MKRYKDYMDGVKVSDTLHEKLKNLEEPKKKPQPWVKWGAMAAAMALVVGIGVYGVGHFNWGGAANLPANGTVDPEGKDVPKPDIAVLESGAPMPAPTIGGYEVVDGEMAQYIYLPALNWADAGAGVATDYQLAAPGALDREATERDAVLFAGGEYAMATHLLWDGLDWGGFLWFEEDVVPDFVPDYDPTYEDGVPEDGVPCAAALYADGDGVSFTLEVRKGGEVPSCVVLPDEYYETSQWEGVEITAVKNGGSTVIDGVELNEKREVSFFCDDVGYKLTLYAADAARADELCARFVRYAIDGGFHLSVLPFQADDLPNKGLPSEVEPTASILHPGDPGYADPIPESTPAPAAD